MFEKCETKNILLHCPNHKTFPEHSSRPETARQRQGTDEQSNSETLGCDVDGSWNDSGVGGVNFEGSGRRWVLSFTGLLKGCRLSVADHPLFILSRSVLTYRWCDERRRLERAAFTRPSRAQTSVCESRLVSCLVVAQMVRGRTTVIRE